MKCPNCGSIQLTSRVDVREQVDGTLLVIVKTCQNCHYVFEINDDKFRKHKEPYTGDEQ